MKSTLKDTGKMVRLAILVAVIILMAFTPLGYLRTPTLEITFIMIPVAIAAITVGPAGGAIAGGVFGITSFMQCFGLSPFGTTLLSINPVFTFIMCIFPRILAGWLPGLLYKAVNKIGSNKTTSAISASIAAPLLNTVLFIGALFLLFGNDDFIRGFGDTAWAIIVVLVGVNGLVEAGVGVVVGATVSRTLVHFFPGENQMKKAGKETTA